jgi:predicted ATPase
MLTRITIKGFKNLLDVDVRFGPFTCVAGRNGVGKSNLFDAIKFLSLLSQHPIMKAAQLVRETDGRSPDPKSLFTAIGQFRAAEIRLSAEMIVDRHVQDDLGEAAEASISAVRYEVAFRLDVDAAGGDRLELVYEALTPVRISDARGGLEFPASSEFLSSAITGRRTKPFISTDPTGDLPVITVHQEGHGGRKVIAPKSSRTVVGATESSDFPGVLAARREMSSWRTLLLEPSSMRGPSEYRDEKTIDARGANLPSTLKRLQSAETRSGQVYSEVANRLSELIQDVDDLRVKDDPRFESLTLEVRGRDGVYHPARSLSDGTLRFLVLSTLAIDPTVGGIICLEEPETGIHPERIPAILRLLKDIAVDADLPVGLDNPLRQVLINTHSPEVVKSVSQSDLVFIDSAKVIKSGATGNAAVVTVPAGTWRAKMPEHPMNVAAGETRAYYGNGEQLTFAPAVPDAAGVE